MVFPPNNSSINPGTQLSFHIEDNNTFWSFYSVNDSVYTFFSEPYEYNTNDLFDGLYNITIFVKDAGQNTASEKFYFQIDSTNPSVISTNPSNSSSNISLDSPLVIVFSKPMDQNSIALSVNPIITDNNFDQSWSTDGSTLTITHSHPFYSNTTYTVTISEAWDVAGNAMAGNYSFSFTTQENVANESLPDGEIEDPVKDGASWFNYLPYIILAIFLIVVGIFALIMLPKLGAGTHSPDGIKSKETDTSKEEETDEDLSDEKVDSEGTSDGDE
jgi:hypothetical protein